MFLKTFFRFRLQIYIIYPYSPKSKKYSWVNVVFLWFGYSSGYIWISLSNRLDRIFYFLGMDWYCVY